MSVREYRDARKEVERIAEIILKMKEDLISKIAESELENSKKKSATIGNNLKIPFVTKVDDDLVFRLARSRPIQIIPITEE